MVFKAAQRSSLLVSAIAFIVLPGIALTGMQSGKVSPASVLAAQPTGSIVEQLNLTNQQKQKIRAIRRTRNQSISKVLTATQRTKLARSLRAGTKMGVALQTLNLNAEQQQQMSTIVRQANQAIEATLTSTQRQQLEVYRRQHQATAQGPIE